jgi:hypothetical protein
MGNIGLPYKSGLGSALKCGTTDGFIADKSYSSKTFYLNSKSRCFCIIYYKSLIYVCIFLISISFSYSKSLF